MRVPRLMAALDGQGISSMYENFHLAGHCWYVLRLE